MRAPLLALGTLVLVSATPLVSHAAPVKAAYFYNYMSRDHLDSLARAGFNRAVIKSIGDSLGTAHAGELRAWLDRGQRVGMEVAVAWAIQAQSRVQSLPPDRRYTWGTGTVERTMGCPVDSAFWRTAVYDRALEMLRGAPALTRLHVDLESYSGSRTHYNSGPCRCRPCLAEYAAAFAGRPAAEIPTLETYQEARVRDIFISLLARLTSLHPQIEITFFDLDLDSFVHRGLGRALTATRTRTMNFTERTYRTAGESVMAARLAMERIGLNAPLVAGLNMARFAPADLTTAMQSVLSQADGCFIFTTYSLWEHPDKLGTAYQLAGTRAEYWNALRAGFLLPDLEASEIRLMPDPIPQGTSAEVRFTLSNRGTGPARETRWVLSIDGTVVAMDDLPLGANGSVAVTAGLPPLTRGSHVFQVAVDALNQAPESDETNNLRTRTVDVVGVEESTPPPPPPPPPAPLAFPATPVLDNFDRSSGPLGSSWVGTLDSLVLASSRMKPLTARHLWALWDRAVFGANQEAYFTFADVASSSPRQGLLLKVQGRSFDAGAIEVRYDAVLRQVFVATFTPGIGLQDRGPGIAVKFSDNDVLGARAFGNGEVEVYRNGVRLGARSVAGWPFAAQPGRVGVSVQNTSTRIDNFGGGSLDGATGTTGTTSGPTNRPPVAAATATPVSGAAPLAVTFSSAASRDPDGDALTYQWDFGDGTTSTAPNPAHSYMSGTYRPILTVSDGRGGTDRDTLAITVTATRGFPATPIVDNFDRSSGPLGALWVGTTAGASVSSKRFKPITSAYIAVVWNGTPLGPDQEAYAMLYDVTSSSARQGLLMKVQGTTVESGAIEVRYDGVRRLVIVATRTATTGWEDRGTGIPVKFSDDDVLGARVYRTGQVEVFRNGLLIGTRSVAGWAHVTQGGRIGLTLENATSTRFENFGGGTMVGLAAMNGGSADPGWSRSTPVAEAPPALQLRGASPNPFQQETMIHFGLPSTGPVHLGIFDIQGRRVATIVNGPLHAGWHAVRWNGIDLHGAPVSAGVYFARLDAEREARVKRIVLTR
jgi:PKD repeat protein